MLPSTACNVKAQLVWVFRTQASTTLVGNVEGKDMECLYIPLQVLKVIY
jgi:hypothetical protein